jgi:diadenosine tetraphosphate (Ap4A) HIT family hydrolase
MKELRAALEPQTFVISMWEGGSAANQRADDLSDLDGVIISKDNEIAKTFTILEETLNRVSQITHQWNVPEPTWHGHSQRFYFIKDAHECFLVDIVVMKESSENSFLEVERHGTPLIQFDKKGLLKESHCDPSVYEKKLRNRLKNLKESFPIFGALVKKEILRQRPVDAHSFYIKGLLTYLVEIWGIKYRPYQHDFGFRYTHWNFPEEEYEILKRLCYPFDTEELETYMLEVQELFDLTVKELEAREHLVSGAEGLSPSDLSQEISNVEYKELNSTTPCPFCHIEDVEEGVDSSTFWIRDAFPVTAGHTLIIPKRHVADATDLNDDEALAIQRTMKTLCQRLKEEDPTIEGFNCGYNIGAVAGQTVPHVHLHLIPRRKGDVEFKPRGGIRGIIPSKRSY